MRSLGLLLAAAALAAATRAHATSWAKIDPHDPSLAAPAVSPSADAEIILWEITVSDYGSWVATQSVIEEHILIKVFTERGRDMASTTEIPYAEGYRISGFSARTVQPDGSVTEVEKDALYDRTDVRSAHGRRKTKAFVFPGARPGSMLEYRYTMTHFGGLTNYARIWLQARIPTRRLVLRIKPLELPKSDIVMRYRSFNVPFPIPALDSEGYATSTLTNVPAFEEEPHMPPELQAWGCVLLYYGQRTELPADEYWNEKGRILAEYAQPLLKPRGEIEKAARQCSGTVGPAEEQLRLLYAFCRDRVKNVEDDASGLTARQREDRKENKNPEQTLSRGMGTSWDIDLLFASMARARGLDARIAFLADGTEIRFDPSQKLAGLLTETCVAVRLPSGWSFYDPGTGHTPFGRLPWWLEGQSALVPDEKESRFVTTPMSKPEDSLTRRVADLRLSEGGSAEGTIRIERWGHDASIAKETYGDLSETGRAEAIRDGVRKRIPDAEVTGVAFRHVNDDTLPCVLSYHIRVPSFAQTTPSRLFFAPEIFESGREALFTAPTRTRGIAFDYASAEEDSVTIALPESVAVDAWPAGDPVALPGFGREQAQTLLSADGRALCYRRSLRIAENGAVILSEGDYGRVKDFFDRIHAADEQKAVLRPCGPPR
jgi:hypothetical protein